ncbi:MAG: Guanylate kinase [Syntrophaceae bacterium PtaU1.Bin231]|nr:MAG: Guanylate kinase [Syntrophaceae bacterium PtaU1.Bin231]HOG17634.1 hypothetical protein [Syntrophales bacterium]
MHSFVIVSGPSCIGKTPLRRALEKHYPELGGKMKRPVFYTSRSPRPGEKEGVDYRFRPRADLERMREKEGTLVFDVRGDLHALDEEELFDALKSSDALFEGSPFVAAPLLAHPGLSGFRTVSVFISPVTRGELLAFRTLHGKAAVPGLIAEMMRKKLLRRTQKQKGILSLPDLLDIEKRAESAYGELREACRFDHILPNHDGEDSENWDAFPLPVGDARRTLLALADILAGSRPDCSERWETDLL